MFQQPPLQDYVMQDIIAMEVHIHPSSIPSNLVTSHSQVLTNHQHVVLVLIIHFKLNLLV
jgi:hypothetical protein